MPHHLPMPPSDVTGSLGRYLTQVARAVNRMPVVSYFSGLTPNSAVTGLPGDLAINLGSASTSSRVWVKGGSSSASLSRVGWACVRVLE